MKKKTKQAIIWALVVLSVPIVTYFVGKLHLNVIEPSEYKVDKAREFIRLFLYQVP